MSNQKQSDFYNIQGAGSSCIGCGRGSNQVTLMRLRTYSRSLACGACWIKYAACANKNPVGIVCNHNPTEHLNKTGPCQMDKCGCPTWVHGLESEADRQLADCVGVPEKMRECGSFGQNLGKCGKVILVDADGTFSRLCDSCMKRWVQEVSERAKEVSDLLNMDVSKQVSN